MISDLRQISNRLAKGPGMMVLAGAAMASAALPAGWEEFSTLKNANAWLVYDYSDKMFHYPKWDSTTENEFIYYQHTQDWALSFSADRFVGNGAVTGNYLTANIGAISCDVFIQDLNAFEEVDCSVLANGPGGERWYYAVPYTYVDFSVNGWNTVRFGFEEQWYYYNGTQTLSFVPDAAFLSNIREASVTFYPRIGYYGKKAAIDNFVLEPNLTPPVLATSRTATDFRISFTPAPGLSADLQRMKTSAPYTWSDVTGQTFITGPAQHVFSTPLVAPVEIFRVGVFADYQLIVTP